MLKILKLLVTMLLVNNVALADRNQHIETFLAESFRQNPKIRELDVSILETIAVPNMRNWDALIVAVNATVSVKKGQKHIKQRMIWFTNGQVITKELTDIKTGDSLKNVIHPSLMSYHYKKENRISGYNNSSYKIAIFSDPLCRLCKRYVTKAINEMKRHPNKFAVYYYHFPLSTLHPAAIEVSKAAIVAQLKGYKDVVLKMYDVDINPREKNIGEILKAFNKAVGTKIKPADLTKPLVIERFNNDVMTGDDLMLEGAPIVFFNNKLDKSKSKWKQLINR